MLNHMSEVTPTSDQGDWQFSLRTCLMVVVLVACVGAAYRSNLAWFVAFIMIVPVAKAASTWGVFLPGLLIGFSVGIAATIPVLVRFSSANMSLSEMNIAAYLGGSALMGATLGAAVNLINRNRRFAGSMLLFLFVMALLALIMWF
jgi:hypothetical protein